MHTSVQQVMKIWENEAEKEGMIRGPEKKSYAPCEPRRLRFSLFEKMNVVNKKACKELYSLQVTERLRDFIGVSNKQSICGLISKLKL